MRNKTGLMLALLFFLACTPLSLLAEIYYYRAADGSLMVTDHILEDSSYTLAIKRNSLDDAGKILSRQQVPDSDSWPFRHHISGASSKYGVDPMLIEAVIQVESGFDPNAVSKKGAGGLMQLMAATAKRYDVSNRFDPKQNIYAGTKHLKYLMNRFDSKINMVLAAYNAGSGSVDKYGGIPPYPETRRYVVKVKSAHNRLKSKRYSLIN